MHYYENARENLARANFHQRHQITFQQSNKNNSTARNIYYNITVLTDSKTLCVEDVKKMFWLNKEMFESSQKMCVCVGTRHITYPYTANSPKENDESKEILSFSF